MAENEEQNEQKKQITDPMILSYFDGTEPQEEIVVEEVIEEVIEEKVDEVIEEVKEEVVEEIKEEVKLEPIKRWDEGLDEKAKFILDKLSKGEDKDVYELLKNKFGYENLSDEQKALTFLQEKNPHLDHDDLLFELAEKYGIGADKLTDDELDLLTDSQKAEIRKQEIAKKTLLNEANKFFTEKATDITIPMLPNPLDEDEGYKEYQTFKAKQEELKVQQEQAEIAQQEFDKKVEEEVNSTALTIDALPIELTIDLDQSEFALKSEFKLDEAKKKQLAEYALEYTPTQAEIKAHQDQSGKLDMKGYMTALAKRLFSEQIQKSALKQALAKDREEFTERELKNTTLRNNDNMHIPDREEAFEVSAMRQ
jgi:hypothetical protein